MGDYLGGICAFVHAGMWHLFPPNASILALRVIRARNFAAFSILYLLSSHATAARLKRQKSQQKQSFFDFKHILTGRPRPNI